MSWCQWLGMEPDEAKDRLMATVAACHREAAIRNMPASSAALVNVASCGGGFSKSVAAALLTLGEMHGPIDEAREVIYRTPLDEIATRIHRGDKIPGWGNAFYRDQLDPAWIPALELVSNEWPDHMMRLAEVTEVVRRETKANLFPNASAFSAVAAEVVGVPLGTALMLAIVGRLPAWAMLHAQSRPS